LPVKLGDLSEGEVHSSFPTTPNLFQRSKKRSILGGKDEVVLFSSKDFGVKHLGSTPLFTLLAI
jgi:hypothetical protein